MNLAYPVGCLLIGIGAGVIYEAGRLAGKKEMQAEVWADANADDTNMGPMGDVRGIRNGKRVASDTAKPDLRLEVNTC